jgi:hypothetical protein
MDGIATPTLGGSVGVSDAPMATALASAAGAVRMNAAVVDVYHEADILYEPRSQLAVDFLASRLSSGHAEEKLRLSLEAVVKGGAGVVEQRYRHKDLEYKYGRMWATGSYKLARDAVRNGDRCWSPSLQGMSRGVRGVLVSDFADDLDTANCQPTLGSCLARTFDARVPVLDRYVTQRQQCYASFFNSRPPDAVAKQRILEGVFGQENVRSFDLSPEGGEGHSKH